MVLRFFRMEKRRPHYDLDRIKSVFATAGSLKATSSATRGALALGMDRDAIVATIQTTKRAHFRKSMTSYGNSTVWQDVYSVPSASGVLYVKFTVGADGKFLLLSFKEEDDGG